MTAIMNCPICGNTDLQLKFQTEDFSVTKERFNILECSPCQFLITTPRPNDQDLSKYYMSENYISHTSSATNLTNRLYLLIRNFTLKMKLSLVNKYCIHETLLDYGCGTGDFLNNALEDNWKAEGVEPSITAKEIAINKAKIVRTIEELSEKKFNAITLWHVLEHVPDPNKILQQLRTKLYDNGTMFIAVPNFTSDDAKHYDKFWAGLDTPRHLWHFSPKAMKLILASNGLKIAAIKPMYFDAPYVSILSENYKAENKFPLTAFTKGLFFGLQSNLVALFTRQYSSLIYVVRK